jgi:hypothetical protein
VLLSGKVYLSLLTFNKPLTPQILDVNSPTDEAKTTHKRYCWKCRWHQSSGGFGDEANIKESCNAICQHCSFRPTAESSSEPAAEQIPALEDELDRLIDDWTQVLLSNLEDPTTQDDIELLKSDSRKLVEDFLNERKLPEELDNDFIQALQEVFSGLEKVEVRGEQLRKALLSGGSPATIDELKDRFGNFLVGLSKGKDSGKVRILIEDLDDER